MNGLETSDRTASATSSGLPNLPTGTRPASCRRDSSSPGSVPPSIVRRGRRRGGARIARAFETALAGIDTRFVVPLWVSRLPLPANRRFEKALATRDEAVHRIIAGRGRDEREGGSALLGMLMQARDEEIGETIPDGQIRDEVTTLYLAGHETMAVTLAWTWYLLSKDPAVARGGVARPRRQGPRHRGPSKLAYTRMVADETLRLYPAAWMLSRTAVDDDVIGNYRVPAGLTVFLSPYVTHRRPELWPNPEGFAPGDDNGRPRFAYFPFGGDPRLCIGNNVALMEATLIIAMTMQRFRLDLVPGQMVKAHPRGTLRSRPAVWMTPHTWT